MRPIINFTEIKRGAVVSSPEGKTSINSIVSKTLQLAVKCNRSENLECSSAIASAPDKIYPDFQFSERQVEHDYYRRIYHKFLSKCRTIPDAIDLFKNTYSFLKVQRLLHFSIDGIDYCEPINKVLNNIARKEAVDLNVRIGEHYFAESFVLQFDNDISMQRCEQYLLLQSAYNCVSFRCETWGQILIILPEIIPTNKASEMMYKLAKEFACGYDHRLKIADNAKVKPIVGTK